MHSMSFEKVLWPHAKCKCVSPVPGAPLIACRRWRQWTVFAGCAFVEASVYGTYVLDCTFKKFLRASSMDEVGGSATNTDAAFLCHHDSLAICTHIQTK